MQAAIRACSVTNSRRPAFRALRTARRPTRARPLRPAVAKAVMDRARLMWMTMRKATWSTSRRCGRPRRVRPVSRVITAGRTPGGRAACTRRVTCPARPVTACTRPTSHEHQLVKATETQLCAGCHRVQVAKTERAVAHMPVREGKMACSTCHNPHGSISNVKALRTGSSIGESCVSCHTEMRGPVLWEHAPVRENCATCHDPHGSSNDRMLVVRQPMLCQRCHVATRHPSSIYDNNAITVNKSNRMFGRSCVNCHSNVHGSNHPSGQYFMR